jgi:hypothetical protein
MTSYAAPIEDITEFNSSLFNQPQIYLTQAQANLLYLSKTNNDTSTATLTTFSGEILASKISLSGSGGLYTRYIYSTFNTGSHEIFGAMTTAGTLTIGGTLSTNSIRGVTTFPQRVVVGTTNIYPAIGTANTVIGTTTAGANLGATSASNVIIGSGNIGSALTTGSNNVMLGVSSELGATNVNAITIGNGVSGRGNSGVYIGTSVTSLGSGIRNTLIGSNTITGGTNPSDSVALGYAAGFNGNNSIAIGNTSRVNGTGADNIVIGTNSEILAGTTGVNGIALGNAAKVNANISNSVAIGAGAIASVSNTIVLGRTTETVIIPNRIQFTPATYSFPFASSQQLGYYLKTTGTATGVTSATPTSIVTTSSIPVGVWRIDFSVQNSITAGGTITQAQSYISNTLDGNVGTAVSFTGSILRSHVSEVYATSDVQIITSSLTYQQTTAGVMYLNIVRSYATGTYSFTGELSVTRIA